MRRPAERRTRRTTIRTCRRRPRARADGGVRCCNGNSGPATKSGRLSLAASPATLDQSKRRVAGAFAAVVTGAIRAVVVDEQAAANAGGFGQLEWPAGSN